MIYCNPLLFIPGKHCIKFETHGLPPAVLNTFPSVSCLLITLLLFLLYCRTNFLSSVPSETLTDYQPSASTITSNTMLPTARGTTAWFQTTLSMKAKSRGCHLVTDEIMKELGDAIKPFKVGLAHFFLQHTSASLTINENWDSDVRLDSEDALNRTFLYC